MIKRLRTALLLLVLVPALLPFVAASAQAAPRGLAWGPCPDGKPGMECASLRVPVDWDRPDGRELTLMLGRLKATGRSEGSVLVAYGGPIGNYIDYTRQIGGESFAGLRTRMDVITWDIRGGPNVPGMSTPTLDCAWKARRVPPYPRNQAEFDALAASNRRIAEECRNTDPELFDHMSSADNARDMDAIRRALGERRLNFYGSSYGGIFAQAYARLFPDRVRTLVLDGTSNHSTRSWQRELESLARDSERSMRRFFDWCADTPSCVLHGSDLPARWQRLVAKAAREPIPAPGFDTEYGGRDLRNLGLGQARAATPDGWDALAKAIRRAERGDASGFGDKYRPYPAVPTPAPVECLELPVPADHAQLSASLRRLERIAPNIGAASPIPMNLMHCVGWPAPLNNPPAPLPEGLPPLLGGGHWNEFDATSRAVRQVPGSGSIRNEGPGHVLYFGNECARAHIDRYLTDRVVPSRGTRC